jgi:hypothetical protein
LAKDPGYVDPRRYGEALLAQPTRVLALMSLATPAAGPIKDAKVSVLASIQKKVDAGSACRVL